MKYVSFDIETGGLDHGCSLLQIAAVIDDTWDIKPIEQLPRFSAFIESSSLIFEPYALNMHMKSGLLTKYLADKNKGDLRTVLDRFAAFLTSNYPLGEGQKYVFAGKNLQGFDFPFIETSIKYLCGGDSFLSKVHHRVIDPATSFTDFVSDKYVASLEDCKRRIGVADSSVTHDALYDALDIVQVVRSVAQRNLKTPQ